MLSETKRDKIQKSVGERETSSLFFYAEDRLGKNDSETQRFTVSDEMDGHRLDFVVSRYLGISRGFSQKLIKEGKTELIPERRIKPSIKVTTGDIISVTVPPVETLDLEPEDVPFETVYSDNDIIVVNKPAGLVVHPAPGHWTGTLVHGLLYRFPEMGSLNGVNRPGIVHRLDATTSGLMVVARNGLAQEGLFRDFKARRVEKEYLALCWGTPPSIKGEIRYPVGRDPYNKIRMAVTEDGRDAWTDYETIWSKNGYSLIKCRLHTGRTHQIRVHMAAIKCPLVGDKTYAPSRTTPFTEPRVFLHSWKLSFEHPRSKERMKFRVALAHELSSLLQEVNWGTSKP
ncbi:MAG: RluA family pseudouridine synthase [Synergistaceae bacterium]|nr:RluA family pseudouridine synthase [Synergistaceae bacterium]